MSFIDTHCHFLTARDVPLQGYIEAKTPFRGRAAKYIADSLRNNAETEDFSSGDFAFRELAPWKSSFQSFPNS